MVLYGSWGGVIAINHHLKIGRGDFEIPSQVWKHSLIGSILTF